MEAQQKAANRALRRADRGAMPTTGAQNHRAFRYAINTRIGCSENRDAGDVAGRTPAAPASGQPLTANEVMARLSDPALQARYEPQEQQRQQKDNASPNRPRPAASRRVAMFRPRSKARSPRSKRPRLIVYSAASRKKTISAGTSRKTTAAAAAAAGEVDRDEPPGAGASLRRIDEQPPSERQPAGDEEEGMSIAGALDALRLLYGARIAALRRSLPKRERAAAIKALRNEKKAAVRELTERKRQENAARRAADRLRRPPPDPSPAK